MNKYIISAFADEYTPEGEKQLIAMNVFGITHIEPRFIDRKNIADLTPDEAKKYREMCDKYSIGISSIGSPIGKIKLDGDLQAHREKTKRVCDIANILGAKYVRIFSFYPADGDNILEQREKVLEELEALIEISESQNIRLCHENEANIYGERPEKCLELLESFGGRLGCVFDMGNFALEGYDPMSAYEMLSPYIDYFHIKDALAAGAIVPPGCGEARIKDILKLYADSGKSNTFVTLEPHLQTFSGLNALVGRGFDNPYKYDTLQDAFADAATKLKEILEEI